MAQFADSTAGPVPTANAGDNQSPATLTLIVISPSNGVDGPLTFPNISASTSVKDVKSKIRDTIPSKPTDDSQRLIHHGRLLSRESETLLEVFGQEALINRDSKTLHLVLRDPIHTPSPTVGDPQRAAPAIPQLARPQSTPVSTFQGIPGQQPLPGFQHLQQHQALHQADTTQQIMSQRLAQLQQETRRLHQEMVSIEQRSRAIAAATQQSLYQSQQQLGQTASVAPQMMPASVRNLIAQQQRERAADGRQGVQDNGVLPLFAQSLSGRSSPNQHRPDHSTTTTREGIGPNGERWSVTVNETQTTLPLGQLPQYHQQPVNQHPALDHIQNILRNADRLLPTQIPQNRNNMQRASSNPLPAVPMMPRVATPVEASSEIPTGTATPATANSSPTPLGPLYLPNNEIPLLPTTSQPFTTPIVGHVDPVVYLLSSPNGPRALLLNSADTFYTPRPSSRRRRPEASNASDALANPNNPVVAPGFPEYRNRGLRPRRGHRDRAENQPLEPANAAAHANPGAGALAAQAGPILWLIVRLVGFVWFFTAGNPSWTRWLMVSALAVVVFIINTGVANGLFEQLWGPIRRHVEALIPLAGPEAAQIPAINAAIPRAPPADARAPQAAGTPAAPNPGAQPQLPQRRHGELDQAQVAAHLLEQHRQRNAPGWLMTQIRRVEHSMLLFLASLVPGVGERHIAAREAEANAAEVERQRLVDEAAAAEAAANPPAEVESELAAASVAVEGATVGETVGNDQGGEAQAPAPSQDQPLLDI